MNIPVYFLLLPGFVLMEFAGPAEALRLANRSQQYFDLQFIGPVPNPVNSLGLAMANVAALPPQLPAGAWLIIPGLADCERSLETPAAAAASAWLRQTRQAEVLLVTICSAALLAARAGLLLGRRCTTHHSLIERLRAAAPGARVVENRVFVIDGDVASSAGVTTGVDLMLELISQTAGPEAALEVAREMVIWIRRDADSPQLSPFLAHRNHLHPALHRVQDAIAADPAHAWPIQELARIACVSPRHLTRLFKSQIGISPVDYRQQMQLAQIAPLLTQRHWSMERIAEAGGFSSARDMRRVWLKQKGTALRG